MKSAILCLLVSTSAMANVDTGPVDTSKLLDEKIASCADKKDAGQVGYKPIFPTVKDNGGSLVFSFGILGLECVETPQGMQFLSRNLNDSFSSKDKSGRPITTKILHSDSVVLNFAGRVYVNQTLSNVELQDISFPLDLGQLFNILELKALDAGKVVGLRLEYYNQSLISLERDNREIFRGEFAGGAYSFVFTVRKDPISGAMITSPVLVQ
jgi:hypothetical protein